MAFLTNLLGGRYSSQSFYDEVQGIINQLFDQHYEFGADYMQRQSVDNLILWPHYVQFSPKNWFVGDRYLKVTSFNAGDPYYSIFDAIYFLNELNDSINQGQYFDKLELVAHNITPYTDSLIILRERFCNTYMFNAGGILSDIATERYFTQHSIPLNIASITQEQTSAFSAPPVAKVSFIEIGHRSLGKQARPHQYTLRKLTDLRQGQLFDTLTLVHHAHYDLSINNVTQSQTETTLTLTVKFSLVTNELTQEQSLDNLTLSSSASTTLTINSIEQEQSAEVLSLTQHNILSTNDASQAQTFETKTLVQHNILVTNDLTQPQLFTVLSLVQHSSLIIDNFETEQVLETLLLLQHYNISIDSISQEQTLDTLSFIQHNVLSVNNLTQEQLYELIQFVQHNSLAVSDLTQGQVFDVPSLLLRCLLTINSLVQGQTSDILGLTQHNVLGISDSLQGQLLDTPSFVQHNVLSVNNAFQEQLLDELTVYYRLWLVLQQVTQEQNFDILSVVQHNKLLVNTLLQNQLFSGISIHTPFGLNVIDLTGNKLAEELLGTEVLASNLQSTIEQDASLEGNVAIPVSEGKEDNIFTIKKTLDIVHPKQASFSTKVKIG